jgi:hypothetical protein
MSQNVNYCPFSFHCVLPSLSLINGVIAEVSFGDRFLAYQEFRMEDGPSVFKASFSNAPPSIT